MSLVQGCFAAEPNGADGDGVGGKADGTGSPVPLIQTNSPFYWAPSDYTGFLAASSTTPPTAIADTDALTIRLQGWVDRIDAIVREQVEHEANVTLIAPKPIVKVLQSGVTFNAWVSPSVACLGVDVAGAPANTTTTTLLRTDIFYQGLTNKCVRPSYPPLAEFRQFWDRHKPFCTIADDLSIGGEQCTVSNYGPPGELVVYSTAPFIHVTTELIAALSEQTVVVVLAHELGHYYRAHVSDAKLQHYNFWYETELDRKKLPVESSVAEELQNAYMQIATGPTAIQTSAPGVYSARLRSWILGLAPLLRERTESTFVCAAARDALGPWANALTNGGEDTAEISSYLAFERALAMCAPQLRLTGDPSATSISYGSVLMTVPNAKLPPVTFPFYATLADVLDAMNGKATDLDDKEAALLRRINENHIGLYTVEQEADNIALSLSTKLGISADDVLTSWLEFITALVPEAPPDQRAQRQSEVDMCKAEFEAGFTTVDASGNKIPMFVPIGNLSEPHHSGCYRLFNFWREQLSRKYEVTSPLVFEEGWDALREHARALSDAARMNGW